MSVSSLKRPPPLLPKRSKLLTVKVTDKLGTGVPLLDIYSSTASRLERSFASNTFSHGGIGKQFLPFQSHEWEEESLYLHFLDLPNFGGI